MHCHHGTRAHVGGGGGVRRVSQSPHDIAVENGGAEVGREQLEVGERAELRGKVCRVEVRRI